MLEAIAGAQGPACVPTERTPQVRRAAAEHHRDLEPSGDGDVRARSRQTLAEVYGGAGRRLEHEG